MKVKYSYLEKQFADPDPILADIKKLVQSTDFTMGKPLQEFEEQFARLCHTKYAVGVGTGTDALLLSLKALGVGQGDEVITAPNTFFATVGAIVHVGATPVFIDVGEDTMIDPGLIEEAITEKTKAIMPVHFSGCIADMPRIIDIAKKHQLFVVEDACQAIGGEIDGRRAGSFGDTGCFSLHPLKNLNVWGDAGIIVTDSEKIRDKLILLRNHGLVNRDECVLWGLNCRMDTLQAVVGNHLIKSTEWITETRIKNAAFYDRQLKNLHPHIKLFLRRNGVRHVYHTYVIQAEDRDRLYLFLLDNGIEAKIHYPIPMHLQKPGLEMGHRQGDFPVAEAQAKAILTLPVHQHMTREELDYVVEKIREFYA